MIEGIQLCHSPIPLWRTHALDEIRWLPSVPVPLPPGPENEFQRSRTLRRPGVSNPSPGMSVVTNPVTFCFEASVKGGVNSVTPFPQLSPLVSVEFTALGVMSTKSHGSMKQLSCSGGRGWKVRETGVVQISTGTQPVPHVDSHGKHAWRPDLWDWNKKFIMNR